MLVIAHLSDTHFGGLPSAEERARRVLDHVAAMDPPVDVVLVTGDIADHGLTDEYDVAAKVFDAWPGPAPLLFCPGNHDVRDAYAAWRGLPPDRPCDTAHRIAGHHFLMLDSLVAAPPGERIDHGELTPATLQWLDDQLAARAPGEPAFVCLHHPTMPIHLGLMDPIRLRNADELAAVLGRHDDVAAVLTGHAHTACVTTFAGLPLLVPGGVASTVTLDAEDLPPITDDLGPGFAVHMVGDGRIVSHWRTL
jgi:3',5'-cyclic AMP phosphodiesterase CpdA